MGCGTGTTGELGGTTSCGAVTVSSILATWESTASKVGADGAGAETLGFQTFFPFLFRTGTISESLSESLIG